MTPEERTEAAEARLRRIEENAMCHDRAGTMGYQKALRMGIVAALAERPGGWVRIEDIPEEWKDGRTLLIARHMGTPWNWVLGTAYWVDVKGVAGWISRGLSEPPGNLGLGAPTHARLIDPPPEVPHD